jgi:hypothetical protein
MKETLSSSETSVLATSQKTPFFSFVIVHRIAGSGRRGYDENYLARYNALWCVECRPTSRRSIALIMPRRPTSRRSIALIMPRHVDPVRRPTPRRSIALIMPRHRGSRPTFWSRGIMESWKIMSLIGFGYKQHKNDASVWYSVSCHAELHSSYILQCTSFTLSTTISVCLGASTDISGNDSKTNNRRIFYRDALASDSAPCNLTPT